MLGFQQQSKSTSSNHILDSFFDIAILHLKSFRHKSMRTSQNKLSPSLKRQLGKTFAQTVSDLKDPGEVHTFLKNFLTENEYELFAKRLAVAYWLKKGRSYSNIKNNLKVSSATIANVQSMAKNPGFKLALKYLEAEEWANVWSEKIKRFVK